jgi:hypothetical protein
MVDDVVLVVVVVFALQSTILRATLLAHALTVVLHLLIKAVELPSALHDACHSTAGIYGAPKRDPDEAIEHLLAPLILLLARRPFAPVYVATEGRVARQQAAARIARAPTALVAGASGVLILELIVLLPLFLALEAFAPALAPALRPVLIPGPLLAPCAQSLRSLLFLVSLRRVHRRWLRWRGRRRT